MLVYQFFERVGQTLAPDKKYEPSSGTEGPTLFDILAPRDEDLTSPSGRNINDSNYLFLIE